MRYITKPSILEAFKWTGSYKQTEEPKWVIDAVKKGTVWFNNEGTEKVNMEIKTFEGNQIANIGDYIIRGVDGEIHTCKPYIFEFTYKRLEETGEIKMTKREKLKILGSLITEFLREAIR